MSITLYGGGLKFHANVWDIIMLMFHANETKAWMIVMAASNKQLFIRGIIL
jgi:hypothetical protein